VILAVEFIERGLSEEEDANGSNVWPLLQESLAAFAHFGSEIP
jgi:hypothetical protein